MSVVELQELEEVKGLIAKGQRVGVLTYAEIATATAGLDVDEADVEELHGFFERSEIELVEDIDPATAVGGGGGPKAKVVGLFGRLTYRVLGPYLHEERELLSHLVRVNEALEKRCDELVLRCEQLNQDMVDRQAAEAENQAKLALWLNLDPPSTAAASRPSATSTGDGDNASTR